MPARNLMSAGALALTAWIGSSCRAPVATVPAASPLAAASARPDPALATLTLLGLDGQRYQPLALAAGECHVLVFLSHECPIANAYAPTLRTLHGHWADAARARLFLIHVDPDLDRNAASQHALAYDLPGTILLDPEHLLVRAMAVTMTPEAVVWTTRGITYQGRIDDQWRQLGSRATAARQHDLLDAVARTLAGKVVPGPHRKAIGCAIPELAR